MTINFDNIEIMAPDYGGGTVFYHNNSPFTGTIVEYDDKGVLISEFLVLNGSRHGRSASYDSNGRIIEEGFISNNRPYGLHKEWDEHGILIKEINFGKEYQP
jgi:antitoxin component YwqK of YwqJK toxin-antitoxin module